MRLMTEWKPGDEVNLISFDIDGTLTVGDPPGVIPVDAIRRAQALGYLVGSCSDRTLRYQRELWELHGIEMDFVVVKQGLLEVKSSFDVNHHLHIGDSDVDAMMARQAGFSFLHALDDDVLKFLREHDLQP